MLGVIPEQSPSGMAVQPGGKALALGKSKQTDAQVSGSKVKVWRLLKQSTKVHVLYSNGSSGELLLHTATDLHSPCAGPDAPLVILGIAFGGTFISSTFTSAV